MDTNYSLGYQPNNATVNPLTGMANFINQCVQSYNSSLSPQSPGAQGSAPFYPSSQQMGRNPYAFNSAGAPMAYMNSPHGPPGGDSGISNPYGPGAFWASGSNPGNAYQQPMSNSQVPMGPSAFPASSSGGNQVPVAYGAPAAYGAPSYNPPGPQAARPPQAYRPYNLGAFYPSFQSSVGDGSFTPNASWGMDNSYVNAFPAHNAWLNQYSAMNPGFLSTLTQSKNNFSVRPKSLFSDSPKVDKSSKAVDDSPRTEDIGATAEAMAAAGKTPTEPELDLLSKYSLSAQPSNVAYNPGVAGPSAYAHPMNNPAAMNNESIYSNPAAYNHNVMTGGTGGGRLPDMVHAVPFTFVPNWNHHAAAAAVPYSTIYHPGAYNTDVLVNPASD